MTYEKFNVIRVGSRLSARYSVYDGENDSLLSDNCIEVDMHDENIQKIFKTSFFDKLSEKESTLECPEIIFFLLRDYVAFTSALIESVYDSQCLYYPLADYGTESICISFTNGEIDLMNTIVKL